MKEQEDEFSPVDLTTIEPDCIESINIRLGKPEKLVFEGDAMTTQEMNTQEKIDLVCKNFAEFLKEKNKRYGDSAISPIKVFSKNGSGSQICNRLDDKLMRIKNSTELKKNDVADVCGYLILLLIEKGWLQFNDLLD